MRLSQLKPVLKDQKFDEVANLTIDREQMVKLALVGSTPPTFACPLGKYFKE